VPGAGVGVGVGDGETAAVAASDGRVAAPVVGAAAITSQETASQPCCANLIIALVAATIVPSAAPN